MGYNVVMEKRNGADEKALQQYVLSHIPVTTPTLSITSRRFIQSKSPLPIQALGSSIFGACPVSLRASHTPLLCCL